MQIRNFYNIIRELSLDQIRSEAYMAPKILIVSRDSEQGREFRQRIFETGSDTFVETTTPDAPDIDPLRYDVILLADALEPAVSRTWSDLYRRVDEQMPAVHLDSLTPAEQTSPDRIRDRIASVAGDRAIAIGRFIEAMRGACAERIVSDTAKANGQFALVSNIPGAVPIVGTLIAAGADFFVLTKNQLLMVFKLAGVYGRDLDKQWRIFSEMVPVIGAGLAWRTVARQLATIIPFAMGTVPKVAIAYAGTYATGRAAGIYYAQGDKLDSDQFRELYAEALAKLRRHPIQKPGGVEDDVEITQLPTGETAVKASESSSSSSSNGSDHETKDATSPGIP